MKQLIAYFALGLAFASTAIADPTYTDDDQLELPQGYETWVFVGTNLGLGYVGEAAVPPPKFHNVYMETKAYLSFIETGKFPDPTQFVFEVYSTADKVADGVINSGVFNSELLAVEAAVKDSKRPTRPDSDKIWAYYDFPKKDGTLVPTATAHPDNDCWACHDEHAGYDNVWVQLYPRLKARLAQ